MEKKMSIALRKIREEDLEKIMEWRMRPDITAYMKSNPQLTIEEQRKWLKTIERDTNVAYWMILVDQQEAGVINLSGLNNSNQRITWGFYMGERKLRSIKTALSLEMSLYDYVFTVLRKKAVYSECFSLNEGVISLHKLTGCKIVKEEKRAVCKENVWYDMTIMEITDSEWEECRKDKHYEKIEFDIR